MMQNQAAVEALYSATFVEDYLDYVENVPDDIQRFHTMLRELDMRQHQDVLTELDGLVEQFTSAKDALTQKRLLNKMMLPLITSQDIGDDKIQLVQNMADIIENKTRQLDYDSQNLDFGKGDEDPLRHHNQRTNSSKTSGAGGGGGGGGAGKMKEDKVDKNGGNSGSNGGGGAAGGGSGAAAGGGGSGGNTGKRKKIKDDDKDDNGGNGGGGGGGNNTKSTPGGGAGGGKKTKKNNQTATKKRGAGGGASGGAGGGGGSSAGAGRSSRVERERSVSPAEQRLEIDPDEPTYCLCDEVSYGEMIGCDNDLCPIEWFHFNCVGLSGKPKGKWFCPFCRGDKATVMKPKAQFLKELDKYNKEREEKLK
eukprot:TRINITY_DN4954_c0_g1_i1.p1 TRINITY_DN4954_c0_g1~~TRINITY_DN4954_c0_g1_i1.p1  ORF type:complete len:365 (+),score=138.81 TRINITY_DN4954_c0_g1_i1:167-1261(+)